MAIDLSFNDDQLLLQQSANEFFKRRYPSEYVRIVGEINERLAGALGGKPA